MIHNERVMSETNAQMTARVTPITYLGVFVALFGMLIARQLVNVFWPGITFTSGILKEAGMWLVAAVIVLIIRVGEKQPLTSIGFHTTRLLRSLLRGLVLGVVCLVVAAVVVAITHYNGGESGAAMARLPLWLITLIVIRAGVVEELCYRGYAIERLHALGLPRSVAALVPLGVFGVGHWTGGWANIVLALALGAILAAFYVWRRDLLANMFGHFLVDFAGNVLPKLVGGS